MLDEAQMVEEGRIGRAVSRVCVCVCVCACLSTVRTLLTLERNDLICTNLAYWFNLTHV